MRTDACRKRNTTGVEALFSRGNIVRGDLMTAKYIGTSVRISCV